jgi:hypothetical protein
VSEKTLLHCVAPLGENTVYIVVNGTEEMTEEDFAGLKELLDVIHRNYQRGWAKRATTITSEASGEGGV